MRKLTLLSGVAGLMLLTAPAFAQDATSAQTPPEAQPGQAAAPTLTLTPGTTVRGSDGDLGVLVGARTNGDGQELTVQGSDGVVRAVPLAGLRQDGEVVVVDFTLEQYAAAEIVPSAAEDTVEPRDDDAVQDRDDAVETPPLPTLPPADPADSPLEGPVPHGLTAGTAG